MHRLRLTAAASLLAASALACGGGQPKPVTATTEIASAEWTTENRLQEENARLEKERDEARAALIDERADHARDLERYNADNAMHRERDDLEMRALEALALADVQEETLRRKAKSAGADTRRAIETTLRELDGSKANLRSQLQRMHGEISGAAFEALKSDIGSTIDDLDRAAARPAP